MYVPPDAFVDATLSLCLKPFDTKSIPVLLPKLKENPLRVPAAGAEDPPPQILDPDSEGPLEFGSKIPKDDPSDDVGIVSGKLLSTLDPNNSSLLLRGEAPKGVGRLTSKFVVKPTLLEVVLGGEDEILL